MKRFILAGGALFMASVLSAQSSTTCNTYGSTTRCTTNGVPSTQPLDQGAILRSGADVVRPVEPSPRYEQPRYEASPPLPDVSQNDAGDVDQDFMDRIVRLVRIGECRAAVDLALSRDSAALGRRVNQLCER